MTQTLREQVAKMANDPDLKPEEFSKLILDQLKIAHLSDDDKKFLEEFTNLEMLAMNNTGIKSLANLPDAPALTRIELTDNHMSGNELKHLLKYPELKTIKFGANNLKDYSELEVLAGLKHLVNLDLDMNPIHDREGYKEKVFEMLPQLQVLDGCDREGNEQESEEEDDEDYGDEEPEGEGDQLADDDDEDGEAEFLNEDDDEEGEYDDEDYGDEEGEDEGDDGDDEPELGKRGPSGGNGGAPGPKRQK